MKFTSAFLVVVLLTNCVYVTRSQFSNNLVDQSGLLPSYSGCWAADNERYVLFWTVKSLMIDIAIVANGTGWVAVGFNKLVPQMVLSDIVFGTVFPNGTVYVDDYYADDYPIPGTYGVCKPFGGSFTGVCKDTVRGGTSDVFNIDGSEVGGVTTIKFARSLSTSDKWDVPLTPGNEKGKIYAMNTYSDETYFIVQHDFMNTFPLFFNDAPECPKGSNGAFCSGNGGCMKGCCQCNNGWTKRDCSLNVNTQSTLPAEIIASEYDHSAKLSDAYKLYWKIFEDTQQIEIAVEVKGTGWVGFGPSESGIMLQSDVILGYVDGSVVTLDDYYIDNRVASCSQSTGGVCKDENTHIGGTNDIIDFNGNVNNGVTQLKWIRKLDTGDTKGDIVIKKGTMFAVWAFHPTSQGLTQHEDNTKGVIQIDFYTGDVKVTDLRGIHGLIMFLVWAVLVPAASFVARFMKHYKWWFNVHRILNGVAVLSMIAAFVIAIVMTTTNHFQKDHAIVGLTVVILGVLQPVLGIIADRMYDPDRTSPPIFPDMTHWVVGWSTVLLAMINVFLGLILYGNPSYLVAYGIYFGIVVAFISGFAIYKGIVRTVESK